MILDQPNTCSLSYWVKRCYLISEIKCAHIPAYVFGQIKPYGLVCSYPFSTPKRSIFIQQTSALRKKKKIAYTFGHFSLRKALVSHKPRIFRHSKKRQVIKKISSQSTLLYSCKIRIWQQHLLTKK